MIVCSPHLILNIATPEEISVPHVLLQGVWSRALGLPIERPKSYTSDAIILKFKQEAARHAALMRTGIED